VEPLRTVYIFRAAAKRHLNPQEKSLPAQVVATAALLQAVWSRCGGLTPFKAATAHLNPQEKSLPAQVVATAALLQAVWSRCGGLHLLERPSGTLEPPRKESAGTGGGQGSAFASCVEPLRRAYTF